MSTALRLSDMIGRGVAVEWFEAVALVREVAERVLDRGNYAVPELHQVSLDDTGLATILGGTVTDEPVRRLGQLLQAALVHSAPPVQLRLVVGQATSATPSFGSIGAFDDALGYFERPDRPGVLRGLYARASAAPPKATEDSLTLDKIAPLPTPEPKLQRRVAWRKNHITLAAAVGAIVCVAGIAGYAAWRTGLRSGDVSAATVKAADVVGKVVASGLSSVTERVGLGRLASVTPGADVQSPRPPEVPVAVAVRISSRRSAPAYSAKLADRVFDLEPVPAPLPVAPELVVASERAPASSVKPAEVDTTIYSAADAVTPPASVRPQLPRTLPPDLEQSRLARIELIVLPSGRVQSARLLGYRDVKDSMLVSAAKAWEFQPALKDGRPVSYRKIVWMAIE